MIQVTKPVTPSVAKVQKYLDQVHARAWLTNNGPLVKELTVRLQDYLGVRNLILTANGTLALQVAYKALGVDKEAVTSPFTFVATASALKWQGVNPRFADIEADTLGLCPQKAEEAITRETQAIVPVHVYGNPCDVEVFEELSKAHSVPIIYDASHTFAVKYRGSSVLNWGDASTLSFHATKLFHTVEGGGIVFKDHDVYERAQKMLNFGLGDSPDDIATPGINAKMSEIHAAYGLCILDSIDHILERRAEILNAYRDGMNGVVNIPHWREGATQNAAYAPILLESEHQCLKVLETLKSKGVVARRYFYPSLNTVSEFRNSSYIDCPNSVDASSRALCLPIYPDLADGDVRKIIEGVKAGCNA